MKMDKTLLILLIIKKKSRLKRLMHVTGGREIELQRKSSRDFTAKGDVNSCLDGVRATVSKDGR